LFSSDHFLHLNLLTNNYNTKTGKVVCHNSYMEALFMFLWLLTRDWFKQVSLEKAKAVVILCALSKVCDFLITVRISLNYSIWWLKQCLYDLVDRAVSPSSLNATLLLNVEKFCKNNKSLRYHLWVESKKLFSFVDRKCYTSEKVLKVWWVLAGTLVTCMFFSAATLAV
jgi:hypothetical protein